MGQAAEDLEYSEWSQSMPRSDVNPRGYKVEPTWTMRDGKKIKLSKMETSHINNCIKMLERSIPTDPARYGGPSDDAGDGAIDAFESEESYYHERMLAINHNISIFKKELANREVEC